MKQQLWILNSSLVLILAISLLLGILIKQTAPPMRSKKIYIEEEIKEKKLSPEEIENIYKYDLFGTSIPHTEAISFKKLVTPMPKPKVTPPPKPPAIVSPKFIPSLKINLKGIAFSADEEKSICIVEDETKKENVFHVGDMIKDSQLIKIAQNRITLLRANGQHETIFIRTADKKNAEIPKNWNHVVRKVDNNKFEIDMVQFVKEIPTLGTLTDMLSLLTAYQNGSSIGTKVSDFTSNSIGPSLGLKQNDIIVSINDIESKNRKGRIQIYDAIAQAKKGATISLSIKRNDQLITLTYNLSEITKPKRLEFIPGTGETASAETPHADDEQKLFKLSKLQERERKRREFSRKHNNKKNQENVIAEIRKRLLDNIQSRVRNTRIR